VTDLESNLERLREEVEVSRERLQRQKVELSTLQGQLSLATREVENFETKASKTSAGNAANSKTANAPPPKAANTWKANSHRPATASKPSKAKTAACNPKPTPPFSASRTSTPPSTNCAPTSPSSAARNSPPKNSKTDGARLSELREISIRRETEIESFTQRIEAATAENARLAEECETHRAEIEDLQVEINTRAEGRAVLLEAIETAETQLAAVRRDHAKVAEQKGREEVAATKLDLRLENLTNSIQERYQIDLSTFEPDAHALLASIASQKALQSRSGRQVIVPEGDPSDQSTEDDMPTMVVDGTSDDDIEIPGEMTGEPDWDFVESIVTDIKRRLDAMGPVNLDAIEEFEELEERYNFLKNQHDDLVSSKAELLEVIDRINTETQRLFAETFAQVRINFREMFKELFGEKGEADLTLLDEGDPLESGIEVTAKPPGKKLQSITLLSGGERSMTAVALLFSIYMIKPSPFCVLDELDAPLDESNIGRFVKVLDRFIDRSQFIIVTHSKRTMARADVMYGVTMEEFGVSKPVGMRLTNADDTKSGKEPKTGKSRPQRMKNANPPRQTFCPGVPQNVGATQTLRARSVS
jgi:chromosome segregation protein